MGNVLYEGEPTLTFALHACSVREPPTFGVPYMNAHPSKVPGLNPANQGNATSLQPSTQPTPSADETKLVNHPAESNTDAASLAGNAGNVDDSAGSGVQKTALLANSVLTAAAASAAATGNGSASPCCAPAVAAVVLPSVAVGDRFLLKDSPGYVWSVRPAAIGGVVHPPHLTARLNRAKRFDLVCTTVQAAGERCLTQPAAGQWKEHCQVPSRDATGQVASKISKGSCSFRVCKTASICDQQVYRRHGKLVLPPPCFLK
eukprot:6193911-Pleurochrysis_carterae.AAC.1